MKSFEEKCERKRNKESKRPLTQAGLGSCSYPDSGRLMQARSSVEVNVYTMLAVLIPSAKHLWRVRIMGSIRQCYYKGRELGDFCDDIPVSTLPLRGRT